MLAPRFVVPLSTALALVAATIIPAFAESVTDPSTPGAYDGTNGANGVGGPGGNGMPGRNASATANAPTDPTNTAIANGGKGGNGGNGDVGFNGGNGGAGGNANAVAITTSANGTGNGSTIATSTGGAGGNGGDPGSLEPALAQSEPAALGARPPQRRLPRSPQAMRVHRQVRRVASPGPQAKMALYPDSRSPMGPGEVRQPLP